MIDILVLYVLNGVQMTMYGVSKKISLLFAPYTKPGFGTIKPALKRLELKEFIISRKEMSSGGKLSVYYSITEKGLNKLKQLIVADISNNPAHFFSHAAVKIICSSLIPTDEQFKLFSNLKTKAILIKSDTDNLLNQKNSSLTFFQRIVLDNTDLNYKNFINMVEGLINGCKNQ